MKLTNPLFILILLLFVLLQASMYSPLLSDENSYFYLGKLVSEGKVPYRDFFYSHPPLQIYVFSFIFKLVGYNFFILKSVAILSTMITAFIIYKLAEGKTTKLLAVSLFLFSSSVFFTGSANMGINLTTAIVMLSLYALSKKKILISGMLLGLASLSGLYAIPIFLGVALFLWRKSVRLFLGVFIITLPINLLFYFTAGMDYINQVFLYHLSKPMEASALRAVFFSGVIVRDIVLFALVILSITIFISKKESLRNIYLYNLCIYIIFLAFLSKPISYYIILAFPFAALFVAERLSNIKGEYLKFAALICVSLLIMFMGFRVTRGIDSFNEANRFGKLEEVKEYMSGKEGKLFGDFDVATLIALETGMDMIVSKDLDTYPLAVKLLGIEKIADEIERLQPSYIIIHKIGSTMNPLWEAKRVKEFMESKCKLEKEIKENKNIYLIFACNY